MTYKEIFIPELPEPGVKLELNFLGEQFEQGKLGDNIEDVISSMAEEDSSQFVLGQLYGLWYMTNELAGKLDSSQNGASEDTLDYVASLIVETKSLFSNLAINIATEYHELMQTIQRHPGYIESQIKFQELLIAADSKELLNFDIFEYIICMNDQILEYGQSQVVRDFYVSIDIYNMLIKSYTRAITHGFKEIEKLERKDGLFFSYYAHYLTELYKGLNKTYFAFETLFLAMRSNSRYYIDFTNFIKVADIRRENMEYLKHSLEKIGISVDLNN